ncbi:S9 family peptidase [bacterium]|nr:S9 family peptidase [bacterium]
MTTRKSSSQSTLEKEHSLEHSYQSAALLLQRLESNTLVQNHDVQAHWIDQSDCFWYQRIRNIVGELKHEYRVVDAKVKTNQVAFDHIALARALSLASGEEVSEHNLPITAIELSLSPLLVAFTAFEKRWQFDAASQSCKPIDLELADTLGIHERLSPDGKQIAFRRDYNLWIKEIATGKETALTHDGEKSYSYGDGASGWGHAFPNLLQVEWSADSKRLLTLQRDIREVKPQIKIDYIPDDGDMRAKIIEESYSIASDPHGGFNRMVAIDVGSAKVIAADYPPIAHDANLGQHYFRSFSGSKCGWSADNKTAYFVDYKRDNKSRSVVQFNTESGTTRVLFTETTDTVFKMQEVGFFKVCPDANELFWLSNIDGWPHLYCYDITTGQLKKQLTQGDWAVRDIIHINTENREVFLTVGGRVSGVDPYYHEVVKVNTDTGELIPIASSNHDHSAIVMSPSGEYFTTTRSRLDETPICVVFDCDGTEMLVETADITGLPKGWHWPEPVEMKAADGETAIYGAIFRPSHFDPNKKYPVLEYTFYSNTDSISTSKAAFTDGFGGPMYCEMQVYAELGMIVVTIDGRGTPHRSKAFTDDSYGWAPSTSNIDDRVSGIKQLAARYSSMDLDRVGITGTRGNTQSLYALLDYPDIYKVGVLCEMHDSRLIQASAALLMEEPCADSSENPRHYKHHLHKLKGKLLIRHGMIDIFNTVGGSFRLIHELEKANKDFDCLIMPKQVVWPSSYTTRRTWDFVVKHLMGEEPPKEFVLQANND